MDKMLRIEKPVTAKYVCKIIGVSRPALHRYSKSGIVRSYKLGGKLFYFETEVMEDLRKCR
jgi:predicted site-specific integrase-resolvase